MMLSQKKRVLGDRLEKKRIGGSNGRHALSPRGKGCRISLFYLNPRTDLPLKER